MKDGLGIVQVPEKPNHFYVTDGTDHLMSFGRTIKWCIYYMAHNALSYVKFIVYNNQYLSDPNIARLNSKSLARESIVVFDEAH